MPGFGVRQPVSGPRESAVQSSFRRGVRAHGAYVEKLHGNEYQSGWPDLICIHFGRICWVELKRPGVTKLRPEQFARFKEMANHGAVIFCGSDASALSVRVLDYLIC